MPRMAPSISVGVFIVVKLSKRYESSNCGNAVAVTDPSKNLKACLRRVGGPQQRSRFSRVSLSAFLLP